MDMDHIFEEFEESGYKTKAFTDWVSKKIPKEWQHDTIAEGDISAPNISEHHLRELRQIAAEDHFAYLKIPDQNKTVAATHLPSLNVLWLLIVPETPDPKLIQHLMASTSDLYFSIIQLDEEKEYSRNQRRQLEQQVSVFKARNHDILKDNQRQHEIIQGHQKKYAATLKSEIKRQTQTLRETNSQLEAEITERRNKEVLLKEARAKAEKASQAKSQFLANMSHEVRTPLNAMLSMSSLIYDTDLTSQQKQYMSILHNAGTGLLRIINDILDFSKIEARKLEIYEEPFELRKHIEETLAMVIPAAAEKEIELMLVYRPPLYPEIIGDVARIRQVLLNIASNAVKFTSDGQVTVTVETLSTGGQNVMLQIIVQDTGIGISENKMDIIFDKFSQADLSTTREYGGTGLGLAISKQLTRLMGGEISVASIEQKGSTFTFAIPVKISDAPPVLDISFSNLVRDALPHINPDTHVFPEPDQSTLGTRVLLVEDIQANQKAGQWMLEKLGAQVDVVNNGLECIEQLRNHPYYDIILMDIQMPVMGGLEASQKIRSSPGPENKIPIIAMTAGALPGDQKKCAAAGMNAYLSKPINIQKIIKAFTALGIGGGNDLIAAAGHRQDDIAPSSMPSYIIDFSEAVALFDGDSGMVEDLLKTFIEKLPGQIGIITQAIERGDAETVAAEAHKIKGGAAYICAKNMSDTAGKLAETAKSKDLKLITKGIDELGSAFHLLIKATENIFE